MMKKLTLIIILAFSLSHAGRWICGDTHHHPWGDYVLEPGAIDTFGKAILYMQSGISVGYNFMLVTDHNDFREYWNGNVAEANRLYGDKDHLCLIGTESSNGGHWTLFGVNPPDTAIFYAPTAAETKIERWQAMIRRINGLGGWYSKNHPQRSSDVASYQEFRAMAEAGMTGFELYNGGGAWAYSPNLWPIGGWWDSVLCEGFKMIGLAGSDAHGTGCRKMSRTWAYIDSDSVTQESLIEGLKKGRSWMVAQSYVQDGLCCDIFNMDFTVNDTMMGGTVPKGYDSLTVHLKAKIDSSVYTDRVPLPILGLTSVKLISDGVVVWEMHNGGKELDTLFRLPSTVGRYLRVEIIGANTQNTSAELRAYSGPIYLENGALSVKQPVVQGKTFSLTASPNPFHASLEVRYHLNSTTPVRFEIFSAEGRLVRAFNKSGQTPGTHALRWDGRDVLGRPLAAGVYLVRFQAPEGRRELRALFLK